jgi:hypothetical protein
MVRSSVCRRVTCASCFQSRSRCGFSLRRRPERTRGCRGNWARDGNRRRRSDGGSELLLASAGRNRRRSSNIWTVPQLQTIAHQTRKQATDRSWLLPRLRTHQLVRCQRRCSRRALFPQPPSNARSKLRRIQNGLGGLPRANVPGSTVVARPHQNAQLECSGCRNADGLVPRRAMCPQPLQHLEQTVPGHGRAHVGRIRGPTLSGPLK